MSKKVHDMMADVGTSAMGAYVALRVREAELRGEKPDYAEILHDASSVMQSTVQRISENLLKEHGG